MRHPFLLMDSRGEPRVQSQQKATLMILLLKRGFLRLLLHIARIALLPIEVVDARAYMRLYLPMLEASGLLLTGEPRYISSKARFDDFSLTQLGERVVISKHVTLLTHDYSVTTGLIAVNETPPTDVGAKRPIVIGNNVFIGMNALLLPGTVVEDNVIIGAGAVVRGTIPTDSVVIGNPAEVIGSVSSRRQQWIELASGSFAIRDRK